SDPLYTGVSDNVVTKAGTLEVRAEGLSSDERLSFDVITLNGSTVHHADAEPQNRQWSTRVDAHDYAPGVYFVRIANGRFQKVQRVVIAAKQ
ncbi:MAG TPA: T9SS type A sorting domain-containing protein, partial [Flavobacteriales bacterium]|nr:T9SS type A sorting domain-containing protein [Flavobacteriales bacterium]